METYSKEEVIDDVRGSKTIEMMNKIFTNYICFTSIERTSSRKKTHLNSRIYSFNIFLFAKPNSTLK